MQSENYVPGVSGWKIDPSTGEFELHSRLASVHGKDSAAVYGGKSRDGKPTTVVLTSGELPQTPQTVTITGAEWPEREIPANAVERYLFIVDAVKQIPGEYLASAEFSTEDHSYDRDGSDIRTTLTYSRPETAEEAEARVKQARGAGTLGKAFVIKGDQVLLNNAFVREGIIESEPLPENWRVKIQFNDNGQVVAADQFVIKDARSQTPLEKALAEGDASKILDMLACQISDSEIAQGMKEQDEQFAKRIRKVIAEELRPGRMLHRF